MMLPFSIIVYLLIGFGCAAYGMERHKDWPFALSILVVAIWPIGLGWCLMFLSDKSDEHLKRFHVEQNDSKEAVVEAIDADH